MRVGGRIFLLFSLLGMGFLVSGEELSLYFERFNANFSDPEYTPLCEVLPGSLAYRLQEVGIPSICEFLPHTESLKSFGTFVVEGKMIKDSGDVLEVKIRLSHRKSGKSLKTIYFRGTQSMLWKESAQLALQLAERLNFYIDPGEMEKLHQYDALEIPTFKLYLQARQEEYFLNFSGAVPLYQKVLEQPDARDWEPAQFRLLKCFFRTDEEEFRFMGERLLKKKIDHPEILTWKSRYDYQDGNTFKAKHWLKRVLSEHPRDLNARVTEICIQIFENRSREAQKNLEDLEGFYEKHPLFYFGKIYFGSPKDLAPYQVREKLQEGLKYLQDDDPWLLNIAALALMKHKLYLDAEEILNRAKKQTRKGGFRTLLDESFSKLERLKPKSTFEMK